MIPTSSVSTRPRVAVYLLDTNVLSEIRKKQNANKGVRKFFERVIADHEQVYVSVITLGELRRGVDLIRHRGDVRQANQLEKWLGVILSDYQDFLLDVNEDIAQLWGTLRVPHHENALDKMIAATAIINDLTVVTRNTKDYQKTGAKVFDPFV